MPLEQSDGRLCRYQAANAAATQSQVARKFSHMMTANFLAGLPRSPRASRGGKRSSGKSFPTQSKHVGEDR